ncbi:hypothetical protein ACJX0J_015142, partial [Zea mays]
MEAAFPARERQIGMIPTATRTYRYTCKGHTALEKRLENALDIPNIIVTSNSPLEKGECLTTFIFRTNLGQVIHACPLLFYIANLCITNNNKPNQNLLFHNNLLLFLIKLKSSLKLKRIEEEINLFLKGVDIDIEKQGDENRAFPVEDGKSLQFIYASRQFKTKGGLTATTATTNVYRHRDFKAHMRHTQSECCSPSEVLFCPDFAESLYCHLLCGLVLADDVRTVSATFAHSLVLAFRTFERVWEELCADIRHGVPSPTRVTSPAVRRAVSALLVAPNPALADEVARRCRGLVNWRGVIPALWPRARYVSSIVTGSMEHYVKKLRHYAGALPLVALDYGATEGMIAANVEPREPPESATFAVLPNIAYFEFIPLSLRGCDVAGAADARYTEADPVGLTDVAVGEHYEVVMTTF